MPDCMKRDALRHGLLTPRLPDRDVCFRVEVKLASTSDLVKGFGCRQAYESPSCRNPRATIDDYGDFHLRPMPPMVQPPL
jgi:hypothetical protein